ncbi:steroidogenic acute regulatory protein, mitochondrial-like isoform X1 [Periplaneta americana]|uniref:steroidogenic acute regulatory protein, mitochondrial-like isoform X1 n=1 Tax=Periplaneta americana TaxID=6978 RepID=UPI0037E87F00
MNFLKNLLSKDREAGNEKPVSSTSQHYAQKGRENLDLSWTILNSTDNWRVEKTTADGITVYSKHLPGVGKIFKLSSEIDYPPKELLNVICRNAENIPKWNPSVIESRVIEKVDEHTEVHYQAVGIASGLLSGRDFVNIRRLGMKDGAYISSGVSTEHPAAPPLRKYIRAENGPNCWVFRPIPGKTDRCNFEFLSNINLKGWLPQYLVDSAMSSGMVDTVKYIREYVHKMKQQED